MPTNSCLYYVLRERKTRRLMPAKRIPTRAEFEDTGPPRLFTTKAAAANALACWRMGLWRLQGDEDGYSPEPSTWKGNAEIAARRKAMEIDVVPMRLLSVPLVEDRTVSVRLRQA